MYHIAVTLLGFPAARGTEAAEAAGLELAQHPEAALGRGKMEAKEV